MHRSDATRLATPRCDIVRTTVHRVRQLVKFGEPVLLVATTFNQFSEAASPPDSTESRIRLSVAHDARGAAIIPNSLIQMDSDHWYAACLQPRRPEGVNRKAG